MRSFRTCAVSALFRSFSAASAVAVVVSAASAQSTERLGTISFPNSGNAAAQEPFLRGMKLYWSFEYGPAANAFIDAQKADPSFALAYVGEALTHTHQVWNEQNLTAARAALAKLAASPADRRAKTRTPREQMYLEMAEVLYGEGSKPRRDTLFTAVAERIARTHPTDDEAKMFHAIGLLGLNQSVREFTTYMRAGAIAEEVLRRNADHPAAAHFVIHAFDDPVHAPLGLWAARLYSKIAPGAPHAQHMTSHIFVALGMWDDVVSQNVIAAGHNHDVMRAGHYTWWLGYAYGQQGRYADALKHLETTRRNMATPYRRGEQAALVMLRAHYLIDAERWNDAAASWPLPVPPAALATVATDSFVVGFAALKRGEVPVAARLAAWLMNTATSAPADARPTVNVLGTQLRAAIASVAGRHADAATLAKEAAAAEEAMPFEFGPPQFVKPPFELLGEVLLAAGKSSEAQAAFQKSLSRTPGRTRSVIGLARAASAAGDKPTAAAAAGHLESNWRGADKGLQELNELAKLVAGTKP